MLIDASNGDADAIKQLKYNGAIKKSAVDHAMQEWISSGYKNQYAELVSSSHFHYFPLFEGD
jgi:hypothetical protein